MIRIIRGSEVSPGIWAYAVPSEGITGRSRQPLLDACRQIKQAGVLPGERAGLFREGSDQCDISCPVDVGAAYTVSEIDKGRVCFRPFREFTGIPGTSSERRAG